LAGGIAALYSVLGLLAAGAVLRQIRSAAAATIAGDPAALWLTDRGAAQSPNWAALAIGWLAASAFVVVAGVVLPGALPVPVAEILMFVGMLAMSAVRMAAERAAYRTAHALTRITREEGGVGVERPGALEARWYPNERTRIAAVEGRRAVVIDDGPPLEGEILGEEEAWATLEQLEDKAHASTYR
jgi:hypothetical protein